MDRFVVRRELLIVLAGLVIGAGLGILILFGSGVGENLFGTRMSLAGNEAFFIPTTDSPAPDFQLVSLSGETVRLSDLRGIPVLVNFWATWCGPCLLEMPAIQSRYDRHQSEFAVLAVNYDEPIEQVRPYVDQLGLTFDVLLDPAGEVQRLYRVRGYPTTYLVDAEGVIRIQHIGLMSEEQLDRYLAHMGVGK
jgi:peroxiredoxin